MAEPTATTTVRIVWATTGKALRGVFDEEAHEDLLDESTDDSASPGPVDRRRRHRRRH